MLKEIHMFLVTIALVAAGCSGKQTSGGKSADDGVALTNEQSVAYKQKGAGIAQASFTALSSELKSAIQRGGPEEAIQYCNEQALPLTDSLSKAYGVQVKRTALRIRNPENAPTEAEKQVLEQFKETIEQQGKAGPVVSVIDGKPHFFAPIVLKPQCLMCHGTVGKQVSESFYNTIKSKYPDDNAVGFKEGELRGMWSIQFNS